MSNDVIQDAPIKYTSPPASRGRTKVADTISMGLQPKVHCPRIGYLWTVNSENFATVHDFREFRDALKCMHYANEQLKEDEFKNDWNGVWYFEQIPDTLEPIKFSVWLSFSNPEVAALFGLALNK